MFRHCSYEAVLRTAAPLLVTDRFILPMFRGNTRGATVLFVVTTFGTAPGNGWNAQVQGSADGTVWVNLGSPLEVNYLQSVGFGVDQPYVFELVGTLPPYLGMLLTPVGAPGAALVAVEARAPNLVLPQ